MYDIHITDRALKSLEKLPRLIRKRISQQIYSLRENPFNENVKKLVGTPSYRLRVGDYRVIFDIQQKKLIILVLKVGHRKNIYK